MAAYSRVSRFTLAIRLRLAAEVDALQACIEHPCAAHELDVFGCWEDLAPLHHRHGRLDEAIHVWEQAIAAGYRSAPHPRANVAELLVESGRRDEADALYERLRGECGDDVWLYNSAGYAYAAAGDHGAALRWIDAGLDLALESNGEVSRRLTQSNYIARPLVVEAIEEFGWSSWPPPKAAPWSMTPWPCGASWPSPSAAPMTSA